MHWAVNLKENLLVPFVQIPQNIKGVEVLIDGVNSTHVWIILFHSFRFHGCFTIYLFSLSFYHHCIMACCQHVRYYFLLITCIILMERYLQVIIGSPFDGLQNKAVALSSGTFAISLEKGFLFVFTIPY